ncbi:hypothetical protein CABS03_10604 [Colletotrichum abscissum]|uniref:Uncharacterized protein n=1 Tax=Colletotrichum abscissum TaxID=1671311 RepID=A0A9P9XPL3_9PEZI|nr:hypothetical protein CABS02_01860 [Colletotrichum abscissum]
MAANIRRRMTVEHHHLFNVNFVAWLESSARKDAWGHSLMRPLMAPGEAFTCTPFHFDTISVFAASVSPETEQPSLPISSRRAPTPGSARHNPTSPPPPVIPDLSDPTLLVSSLRRRTGA